MKKGRKNILRKLHESSPLWLNKIYTPFVYFFRHLQTFFLHSYFIDGAERESGIPLKVAYFGRDEKVRNYWESMLFKEPGDTVPGPTMHLWKIGRFGKKNRDFHDLMFVETTSLTRLFIGRKKGYLLPRWFDTLLDVDNALDAISKNDTQKKISMHRLSCEVKTTEDDLYFFYHRMFKPYIKARHKDTAVMVDYSYFQKRFKKKNSKLFFLLKDNKPVAASFNEKMNGMIKFSGLGILDADRDILRMGAVRALYYFMLGFYQEIKVKKINFGGTSPLLSDGLTQFKVALRAFPNTKKLLGEKSIWMIPLVDSNATRCFLISNPFIYIFKSKIYRALFVDSAKMEKKRELLKLLKRTRYRELAGTRINCWNGREKILNWVSEEEFTGIEVNEFKLENK